MKVRITFKTPDVLDAAIQDLTKEEQEEVQSVAEKFMDYGDYLTVEFDTKAKTCVVIEN